MSLNLSPGDLVEVISTGRVGMIIDLTPPTSWGVLQFDYPNCKETKFNLKWLKYRSKISITTLDRKYFLNYYDEKNLKKLSRSSVTFPDYTHLFIKPADIVYNVGDLVTIRSYKDSFFHSEDHPFAHPQFPELQALILRLVDSRVNCLINNSATFCSWNRSEFNLPNMTKTWQSVYPILKTSIIRKLSHYSLKKNSCLECER